MRHNESGIVFEHTDNKCSFIKFDEDNAYKKVDKCLKPTKGVDFLYVLSDNKLVFIEVKNFIGHTNDAATIKRLQGNADLLMTEIALKVRDSIACATASARQSTNDIDFWKKVNESFLNSEEKILIIAWIEFDCPSEKEKKAKMATWTNTLKKKLKWLHAINISINNVDNPPQIPLEASFS